MRTIANWNDLAPYGIVFLTGESCGLMYRVLCDVTVQGKRIIEKCLGLRDLGAHDNWNSGHADDPHVASILLAPDMLVPIGVFALLEAGCTEVWLYKNGSLLGIEPDDPPDRIELCAKMAPDALSRKFHYGGTAGSRNRHVMSGRVE